MVPGNCKWLADAHIPQQDTHTIIIKGTNKSISDLKSQELQLLLKKVLNKTTIPSISEKFKIVINKANELLSWHRLWLIKSPSLRAIRLKVLYKDIYSNERRDSGLARALRAPVVGWLRPYNISYLNV